MKKLIIILSLLWSIAGFTQGLYVRNPDILDSIRAKANALNPVFTGSITFPNSSVSWNCLTGIPTTLSGYGITNGVANTITINGHALSGNVSVTASDLSLGNVTNTSDANKPVSTAQQTALDLKANLASPTFTGTVVLPNSTVTNAMLNGSITYSKLSLTGAILNADLAGSIAYSKLSLTGAILNADLAGSIAYSKLSLTGAVLNADLAGSIAASKFVGSDIATVGTIGTGTWQGTVIGSTYGGTGVNNAGRTLTVNTNSGTIVFGAASKTFTINNTLALSGTDASTLNIGTGGTLGANAYTSTAYQPLATNLTSIGALSNTSGYLNNNGSGVFSYVTPSGTGDMILGNVQIVTNNKTYNAGTLISGANSATNAAHVFTPSGASLKTTSAAGDMEVDANGIPYYSHVASERGVMDAEQFISLTSANTLTSQTAVQPIFDGGGGPANGAFTVSGSKSYYFECFYSLSSMSASSGTFGFAFGGTATFTSQGWQTAALKATITTANTAQTTFNTTANTTIVTANTNTAGFARVWGIVRINAGGTLIPQVSLGVAAAAVVGTNSYFRMWPIGTNTVVNSGNVN